MGTEAGGQHLTKVWLVGAPLELDSSRAGLYQEMSHQLMGHVPWDKKKEVRISHFSRYPPSTARRCCFVTSEHVGYDGRKVVEMMRPEPWNGATSSPLCTSRIQPKRPNNLPSLFSDPLLKSPIQPRPAPTSVSDPTGPRALPAPQGSKKPYRLPGPEPPLKQMLLPFLFCCMMVGGGEDTFMASP